MATHMFKCIDHLNSTNHSCICIVLCIFVIRPPALKSNLLPTRLDCALRNYCWTKSAKILVVWMKLNLLDRYTGCDQSKHIFLSLRQNKKPRCFLFLFGYFLSSLELKKFLVEVCFCSLGCTAACGLMSWCVSCSGFTCLSHLCLFIKVKNVQKYTLSTKSDVENQWWQMLQMRAHTAYGLCAQIAHSSLELPEADFVKPPNPFKGKNHHKTHNTLFICRRDKQPLFKGL